VILAILQSSFILQVIGQLKATKLVQVDKKNSIIICHLEIGLKKLNLRKLDICLKVSFLELTCAFHCP